jgi:hypothetical protein
MRTLLCALVILIVVSVPLPTAHKATPVAAQTDPLAACAGILAAYTPVVGMEPHATPPDIPLPPVREAWRDPVFGTCVVRVTDRLHDFDTPLTGLKNEYSRVQAFNADNTLIMARSVEGDWFLYNAATLAPIQRLDAGIAIDEPRWDAQNPYRFTFSRWYDGVPQYMFADLTPADGRFEVEAATAHDFARELPPEWNATVVWRRWEGSPSTDGRYDAFMAEDADFITRGLITYYWQSGQIVGRYSVPGGESNEPDNVSISPLGDYVMAQFEFCEPSTLGTYEKPCGAMVYTRDLTRGWGIGRVIGHSDLALDAQGREVVVYQETDTDQIVMADLESGQVTPLLDLDFSTGVYGLHISGRAVNRPGWVAVSVQPEAPSLDFSNPFWMVGTVFAVELKANPRVVQLAHHHSIRSDTEEDYFAEPQVTVNRDFTRLLFTSNWEKYGPGEVEMVMIVLPDNWTDRLP